MSRTTVRRCSRIPDSSADRCRKSYKKFCSTCCKSLLDLALIGLDVDEAVGLTLQTLYDFRASHPDASQRGTQKHRLTNPFCQPPTAHVEYGFGLRRTRPGVLISTGRAYGVLYDPLRALPPASIQQQNYAYPCPNPLPSKSS